MTAQTLISTLKLDLYANFNFDHNFNFHSNIKVFDHTLKAESDLKCDSYRLRTGFLLSFDFFFSVSTPTVDLYVNSHFRLHQIMAMIQTQLASNEPIRQTNALVVPPTVLMSLRVS